MYPSRVTALLVRLVNPLSVLIAMCEPTCVITDRMPRVHGCFQAKPAAKKVTCVSTQNRGSAFLLVGCQAGVPHPHNTTVVRDAVTFSKPEKKIFQHILPTLPSNMT